MKALFESIGNNVETRLSGILLDPLGFILWLSLAIVIAELALNALALLGLSFIPRPHADVQRLAWFAAGLWLAKQAR